MAATDLSDGPGSVGVHCGIRSTSEGESPRNLFFNIIDIPFGVQGVNGDSLQSNHNTDESWGGLKSTDSKRVLEIPLVCARPTSPLAQLLSAVSLTALSIVGADPQHSYALR